MRGFISSTWTPKRRCSFSRVTSTCKSPVPCNSVWWREESTRTWSVGSSSRSLCSPEPIFSSSALFLTKMATSSSWCGKGMGGSRTGAFFSQSVCPVWLSRSLTPAPISPAIRCAASLRSFPDTKQSCPLFADKTLLEEAVVRIRGCVQERAPRLLRVRLDLGRNGGFLGGPVLLEQVTLHRDQIDEAAEFVPFPDGPGQRDESLPEPCRSALERFREARVLLVHLRDDAENGARPLLDAVPDHVASGFDPRGRLDAKRRGVRDAEARDHIADEVGV